MPNNCGFVYEPGTEIEVCILFGLTLDKIDKELCKLGFNCSKVYLEEYPDTFPDCTLLLDDNKIVKAEFELNSSNFKNHSHDPKKCDLIICWKNDWINCTLPVLELSKVVSKDNSYIINRQQKHPERGNRRWELEEFRQKIKDPDLAKFIDEILKDKELSFQTGKGKRILTLGIGINDKDYPLAIEDRGQAYIAYYNVNKKPPIPLMSQEKITMIRNLLNETNRLPKPRMWHYIKTKDNLEQIAKLKGIIEIMKK